LSVTSVVMVTQRTPNDGLYLDILAKVDGKNDELPFTL
jgi:dimethylamine/trimethylamine dehydrogenase